MIAHLFRLAWRDLYTSLEGIAIMVGYALVRLLDWLLLGPHRAVEA